MKSPQGIFGYTKPMRVELHRPRYIKKRSEPRCEPIIRHGAVNVEVLARMARVCSHNNFQPRVDCEFEIEPLRVLQLNCVFGKVSVSGALESVILIERLWRAIGFPVKVPIEIWRHIESYLHVSDLVILYEWRYVQFMW